MPFHGDDKEKDGVGCTGLQCLAYCGDLCALEDNDDLCTLTAVSYTHLTLPTIYSV